jgi:hypothetical protein
MNRKLLFILGFFISTFGIAQQFRHTEMLFRVTDQRATVQFFLAIPQEVSIVYGTQPGNYTNQTPWMLAQPDVSQSIILEGLNPNTRYYYRLQHRDPQTTTFSQRPEYTFHTQRPSGEAFTFIVQADPHLDEQSDTAVYQLCLQNQLDDQPDFMVDLGDFLMTDKLKNGNNQVPFDTIPFRCDLLRTYYERIGHSVPLYITLGNHEGESGWNLNANGNNFAVWGTNERKKYFLNPENDDFFSSDTTHYQYVGQRNSYYSWSWGDALFIVLDPYWHTTIKPDSLHGWRWTLGERQYNWLKTTLENSNHSYKFVFSHQIVGGDADGRGGTEYADLYEWGGYNLDGTWGFSANRPGWYAPIKDLLSEHRVSIFFHGHDHFFGKQEKDCLIYQECPQPSHPNFQNVNYAAQYGYIDGQILPNSGHIRVQVSSEGVQVEYVRVYLPQSENATRHNKDVSASYFIPAISCYDSLITGTSVLWNKASEGELIYPNPSRSEVKIEIPVSQPDNLFLEILDQNGKRVKELLYNTPADAGVYNVFWDGTNQSGSKNSPGVYIYKLQSKWGIFKTGRIVLQGE